MSCENSVENSVLPLKRALKLALEIPLEMSKKIPLKFRWNTVGALFRVRRRRSNRAIWVFDRVGVRLVSRRIRSRVRRTRQFPNLRLRKRYASVRHSNGTRLCASCDGRTSRWVSRMVSRRVFGLCAIDHSNDSRGLAAFQSTLIVQIGLETTERVHFKNENLPKTWNAGDAWRYITYKYLHGGVRRPTYTATCVSFLTLENFFTLVSSRRFGQRRVPTRLCRGHLRLSRTHSPSSKAL